MPRKLDITQLPVVSPNAHIQAAYVQMRLKGETHKMAEMLALRTPPGQGFNDRLLMEGHWGAKNLTDDFTRTIYHQIARAHGVNPDGMTYCSQLASFPGDPTAWVDTVGDVKRVAEMKGMKLEGAIEYTPPGYNDGVTDDLSGPYRVSDDIVNEHILDEVAATPELASEYEAHPQKLADRKAELTTVFSGGDDD